MARAKQMETSLIVQDGRDVDFGELELRIQKPTLNNDKTLSISGNFTELGNKIKVLVDRYKGTQLTEDNVEYVKTLKGQFVSLRTGIERERKEYKKVYITPASKLIDSMCDELQSIVAQGENALGAQLEEYDQKRKDELTLVLQEYVNEASEKYHLRKEWAEQIQLIAKYYNKTQHEEDSIEDIERQAMELERKQNEYDASVKLIKAECEDSGFLAETYIRELQFKSAMEIILEIKQDKKLKEEAQAQADRGEKIIVGKPIDEELKMALTKAEDFSEETRTRVLRVTYKPEQAKLISHFFTENQIKFEFIQTDF